MIVCPSCRRVHDDNRDFCECGEFLGWEESGPPTGATAALERPSEGESPPSGYAPAPGAPSLEQSSEGPAAQQVVRGDAVLLSLRLPNQEVGGPVELTVAPGGRTTVVARVRNQSGIVDNYDLGLAGLPEGWWSIVPGTLYLLPLGTEGAYEGEVEVAIHPPLSSDAEAGVWPFEVVAFSRAYGQDVARAPANVVISPYARMELAVRPQRVRGRRRAKVAVAVQNRGNAISDLGLSAVDAEEACRFEIPRKQLKLARGEGIVNTLDIRPRRPIIIGRPIERPFEVTARSAAADEEPVTGAATFVQRPYLPWWVAIVLPLLIAAIVALLALWPRTVQVPDVTKARSVVEAQRMLDEKNLELNPEIARRPVADAPPGSIIGQSPKPGREIEEGAAVSIEVAVGTGRAKIPKVVGLTAAKAESKLTDAGFTVGATEPRLDPDFVVEAQIPKAGERRATGSPVNLFLRPPKKGDGKGGAGAGAGEAGAGEAGAGGGGGGGGGEGGGGGGLVVPDIDGTPVAKATQMLTAAGLARGQLRRVISRESRGTVLSSDPAAGDPAEPGQQVDLVVSAGFPRLALGDGDGVLTVAGATGGDPRAVADQARQPAWTPDGARLTYVSAGRIFLVDPRRADSIPAPLTPGGSANFARPAFGPRTSRPTMAFLRGRGGDGDLCFARVRGRNATRPSCIADARLDLNGRPAWSPRGTEILVPGVVPGTNARRFGLVRYRSATPFSRRASDWGRGRVVTDLARAGRGVIRAAFSPNGRRLAMVTNLRGSSYRVVVTKPTDFLLRDADVLPLPACDLTWRPDGAELAVVIADPRCRNRIGPVLRVDPDRPARLALVRLIGADPDFQPIDLGG